MEESDECSLINFAPQNWNIPGSFAQLLFSWKEIIEIIFYLAAAASSEPEKFLILVNENSTFMMWKCWCKDDENVMLTDFYLMLHINISVYSFFHFVIFFACFRAERRSQKNENKSVHQCVEMWDVKMHSERSEMFQK